MRVLGLNTAWPGCDVSVLQDDATLAESVESMARGQDARVPGLVSEVCTEAGLTLQDIDRIAVITGPGSFTGIRVGVAFARGLALALKIPCLGISSLEAALPAGQTGSQMVLLQAQRRPPDITYWVQSFRNDMETTAPEEVALADLVHRLRAHPHQLFGEGDALVAAAPEFSVTATMPTSNRAARIALERDPETAPPRPAYVRAPDAVPRAAKSN